MTTAVRRMRAGLGMGAGVLAVLLIATAIVQPNFFTGSWASTLALLAPLALAAMASTPAIVTGGVDLSISPQLTFVNIIVVKELLGHTATGGALLVPICLLLGAGVGAAIGLAVAVARVPAVLASLAAFFVLIGVDTASLPNSVQAHTTWIAHLASHIGPVPGAVFTIGVPLVIWLWLSRTPLGVALRAVGSSDGTALSSGINVTAVRLLAYVMGGILAAIAGLAYTAVSLSADSSVSQQYTVLAFAAVALGGTSLAGGRGGLGSSLIGACSLFLIENLLNAAHVSALWLDVAYGAVLLLAIVLGQTVTASRSVTA